MRDLAAVDESLATAEQSAELWFQAEALRVSGELLCLQAAKQAQPGEALSAAEACLEKAHQVAKQQGTKSFELRAVMSPSHLWESESRGENGLDVLLPIVNQFGEGSDTMHMREANALLHRR
jgi:hypothetical protein